MFRIYKYAFLGAVLLSMLLINSCRYSIQPMPEEKPGAGLEAAQTTDIMEAPPQPTAVNTPAPTQESFPTQRQSPLLLPVGLTLEEYALKTSPIGDGQRFFSPLQGTSVGILANRYYERHEYFPDNSFMDSGGLRGLRLMLGEDVLEARQHYNRTGGESWAIVNRNEEKIYRIETGRGGAFDPLVGLWVYDQHWVLEAAPITPDGPVGMIIRDGVLLNELYGYEEMFGFQLMAGHPFFFFKQDGKIGFSFNGEIVEAGYAEIPHYKCCGIAPINPVVAKKMVSFFAEREGVWYYVEVGIYDDLPPAATPEPISAVETLRLSSPDGRWAAILKGVNGGLELLAAGQEAAELQLAGNTISHAIWSTDSKSLLLWIGSHSASMQADGLPLWSLELETGDLIQISEAALVNDDYYSWSPDGSALVFTDGGYRSAQIGKQLSYYDASTRSVSILVPENELVPGQVAWSPDGSTIAFAAVRAEQTSLDWADWMGWDNPAILARRIYLIDPASKQYRLLKEVDNFQDAPRWSTDSETLYFVQVEGEGVFVMKADRDSGKILPVEGCRAPRPSAAGYYGQVDWSDFYDSCMETRKNTDN
jgi:hypothetical protein